VTYIIILYEMSLIAYLFVSSLLFLQLPAPSNAYLSLSRGRTRSRRHIICTTDPDIENEDYRNAFTKVASFFLPKKSTDSQNVLDVIDWKAKKKTRLSKIQMIKILKQQLPVKEWFVTGNVDPSIFDDSFRFQDPDVKVAGIESYARGVNKLFRQKDSRAQIISIESSDLYSVNVTWRLSGSVNIGPGIHLKPFIVYTEYQLGRGNGLIIFQEDKFSIPGWDILLSAVFPFLRPLLSPAAPEP
jgi:hypothetical protein